MNGRGVEKELKNIERIPIISFSTMRPNVRMSPLIKFSKTRPVTECSVPGCVHTMLKSILSTEDGY